MRVSPRCAAACSGSLRFLGVFGQAPVYHDCFTETPDEHVGRLQVPMNDSLTVGVAHGLCDRQHVRQQAQALLERLRFRDGLQQGLAGDEIHHVEQLPVWPCPGLVDGHDIGMLQTDSGLDFSQEPSPTGSCRAQQFFDGHLAVEAPVPGSRDATQSAPRHFQPQVVVRAGNDRQILLVQGSRAPSFDFALRLAGCVQGVRPNRQSIYG